EQSGEGDSYTRPAKPDRPAAAHASAGRGRIAGRKRRDPAASRVGPRGGSGATASTASRRASATAPSAAPTFNATPIHVVARMPSAGSSQKPAAIAPAAAPAVFAA